MSNASSDKQRIALEPPAGGTPAIDASLTPSIRLFARRGWRLVSLFLGVALPLWGFTVLAMRVYRHGAFAFDAPLLELAQRIARHGLDVWFVWWSRLGYAWGVVPFDIVLVVVLFATRRLRAGTFAAIALGGSALLNLSTKLFFARDRPALWPSVAPEDGYSFPSGHAMGSMTLAAVLVLLSWPTRWRWAVLLGMACFVLLVGMSRVYLGVHYPSDILAGWAAALVWTLGSYAALFGTTRRDWTSTLCVMPAAPDKTR